MDVFKKGTLKSQSLNSRFLASNSNNSSTPHRSLPVQSSKPLGVPQNTSFGSASKLKLTTSRQSSALRATRENNLSPALNETGQSTSSNVAIEKKTPVWNKGMAPPKSAKNYTDDELKAMHGISLVSRNSNAAGTPKEGRWDDSDEDDDWGDTIDFGDGTKVTIGQAGASDTLTTDSKLPDAAPPPKVVHSHPHLASPFADQAGGGPWKRAEPALRSIPLDSPDFPAVNAAAATKPPRQVQSSPNGIRHSSLDSNPALQAARPPVHDVDQNRIIRATSAIKDEPISQSNDARYQYDQNTYDRHWQNPPQTREIFNSNTGRFEQIDATHKQGRRLSHNDRKTSEVSQRAPVSSGDARLGTGHAPVLVVKAEDRTRAMQTQETDSAGQINGETVAASDAMASANGVARPSDKISSADVVVPLDPSSQEFIDMQKKLMAERREQAIQRRRDQEAEESARKERARKKAEELAALTEKEDRKDVPVENPTAAKPAVIRPKIAVRPPQQDSTRAIEKNILVQRATSAAIHDKEQSFQSNVMNTSEKATEPETWQRGVRIAKPTATTTSRGRHDGDAKFSHRDPFDLSAPTVEDSPLNFEDTAPGHGRDLKSPPQAAWGPIGSRKSTTVQAEGTNTIDQDRQQQTTNVTTQNPVQIKQAPTRRPGQPSWSAFDGIAKSIKASANSTNENREYNVFDASDEIVSPEKVRHSPSTSGQTQSRTSSRFFPSATAAVGEPKVQNSTLTFVSPSLPPRIDSIHSAFYENPGSAPILTLPGSAFPGRTDAESLGDKRRRPTENKFAKYNSRVWSDYQSRSIWEIKPLKDGHSPRIRVPYTEKSLDWTRKSKSDPIDSATIPNTTEKAAVAISTAIPTIPVWNMPLVLDTTTKENHVKDPLVPLQPSLRIPSVAVENNYDQANKRKGTRYEEDRTSKYYTTRPSLVEETDNMSPIRVKTTAANVKVARRFGKRVDPSQNVTRMKNDVKRQPVNMSDAPGGAGFKRGFANRVRSAAADSAVPATKKENQPEESSKTAVTGAAILPSGKLGQSEQFPVAIMQRSAQFDADNGSTYSPVNSAQQNQRHPPSYNANSATSNVVSSQQYTNHQQSPSVPAHLSQAPMLSRVAPPGLAAPVQATHKNESHMLGTGPLSAAMPPTTSRGPPGIVLP